MWFWGECFYRLPSLCKWQSMKKSLLNYDLFKAAVTNWAAKKKACYQRFNFSISSDKKLDKKFTFKVGNPTWILRRSQGGEQIYMLGIDGNIWQSPLEKSWNHIPQICQIGHSRTLLYRWDQMECVNFVGYFVFLSHCIHHFYNIRFFDSVLIS